MKFDEITRTLGEFGKYQRRIYVFVCLPAIFCGMQMLSAVFTLASPNHRCHIPSLSGDTYEVKGDNHSLLINASIPWVKDEDDDVYVYSSCDVYVTSNTTTYGNYNVPVNVSRRSCDSWVYDKTVFQSTFITQMNLVCGDDLARANANMLLMAGLLVGSLVFGLLSDAFGRKTACMLGLCLHFGGGLASGFAPNYATFVACRFIVGASNVGMFVSCYVIGMELVGASKRVLAGICMGFFWSTGLYLLTLLAFFIRDWDTLHIAISAPAILMFSFYWLIPESPRWLISRAKYDRADKIIRKAAEVNGVKLPANMDLQEANSTEEKASVFTMFTDRSLLIRTLVIYFNWCVVSMAYYGLSLNVGNLAGDVYTNFAINASMDLAGSLLCLLLLDRVGRKPLFVGTMILGGGALLSTIATVLYVDKSLQWVTVVLANVGKLGVSSAFGVVYLWSAELFPTLVRNSGMGSSSMFARVGGMICPYIADLGTLVEGQFGTALPLLVFGASSVAAGVLSLLLPETMGRVLPESIVDAQNFTKKTTEAPSKHYFVNESFAISEEKTEKSAKM